MKPDERDWLPGLGRHHIRTGLDCFVRACCWFAGDPDRAGRDRRRGVGTMIGAMIGPMIGAMIQATPSWRGGLEIGGARERRAAPGQIILS